jgi:acetyl-CoA carboxylase carboxyltransferase component
LADNWSDTLADVLRTQELALGMGGAENVGRQHTAGRLTIRERIAALLDEGSFTEVGVLAGTRLYDEDDRATGFIPSSYLVGLGKIDGRSIVVGGEDFTARGGGDGGAAAKKRNFAEKLSKEYRIPLVLLADSFGADVAAYPKRRHSEALPNGTSFFMASVELLGMVPVVAAALGSVAGGPAGRVILAHWNCMVRGTSEIFAAGPPVVRRSIGTTISKQELGGAEVHAQLSGSVHNAAGSERDCLAMIRTFLSYMPTRRRMS